MARPRTQHLRQVLPFVATARPLAAERGFLIVEGTCFPQDRAEPYAPLIDALRARFAGQPPEAIMAACGPFVRDLQPLLPDLLPLPGQLVAASPSEPDRRRLFAALQHGLVDQDGSPPLLLIIEDLHWCDEASLDFLFALTRRAKGRPHLLTGTYRTDETTPHLRAWVARLEREGLVQEIPLNPLTRDGVEAMVQAHLGPRPAVSTPTIDALIALAEGNPFVVEELLASLTTAGTVIRSAPDGRSDQGWDLRLPRSLHTAVQERVERLSPATRQLLQLAAVVGRRFDVGLLLHLTGMEEPELLARLDELVAAQLVTEESGERFAFRHALTRQAVYGELLARTRTMLHRRIGEATEQVYAATLDQHLGDLTEHFQWAEIWDKAQTYAQRAGERALRLYSSRAAVEQFTRALEAHRRLKHGERADGIGATQLVLTAAAAHRGRGRAYDLLGDFENARDDYLAAVQHARAAGSDRDACRILLDAGLLWASRDYTEAGRYFTEALALARRLAEPALLVDSLNRLGNWHANTTEPWKAPALHQEALALAQSLGDRQRIAATLDLLGMAAYLNLDFAGSMRSFERAEALFRELDDRPALISCLTMLAVRGGSYELLVLNANSADVAAGVRAGEEALALAQAIESPGGEAFAALQLAGILGPRGAYARALELAAYSLRIAETIGHRQWLAAVHGIFATLYLDLLAPERAVAQIERARALALDVASTYWNQKTAGLVAVTYLQLHEPDRAAEILSGMPAEGSIRSVGQWWVTYAHASLALARRDASLALRLCDELAMAGDDHRTDETVLGVRLRAEALAALGRTGEAEAVLRPACEAMRRQDTRAQLWRIYATLGDLARADGRDEDARRQYTAARALIEEIAAGLADQPLRDGFLQIATARLPRAYRLSPLSSTAARFGGLTARERDVAALIARGKSNGDIAEALVLSKRTVETHVGNILTKLGATSRQEIAAWATARGLTTDW